MIELVKRDRDSEPWSIVKDTATIVDADKFRWRRVRRVGLLFMLGEREIELFPLSVFCEAIDRDQAWVRARIQDGSIPPPMFEVPQASKIKVLKRRYKSAKLWYSGAQLVNFNRVFTAYFGGRRGLKGYGPVSKELCRKITEVFYELDVIVSPLTGEPNK